MSDELRRRLELKESYSMTGLWAKAAQQCKELTDKLRQRFPDTVFSPGHGALSSVWEIGEHDPGEPDIFVVQDGITIAGIEVTGSDKVTLPCPIWIAKHKIDYARDTASFPIMFYLFYPNGTRLVSSENVLRYVPSAQMKFVRGIKEYFHIVPWDKSQPTGSIYPWIESMILRFYGLDKKGGFAGGT